MERELGLTLPLEVVERLVEVVITAPLPLDQPYRDKVAEALTIAEREIAQVKEMVCRKGGR